MVEAVNNIIYNLLISGCGVWLPDVGTLCVERRAAVAASSRTVVAPSLYVEFTSQCLGESLVDRIALAASVDSSTARDIYDRWIDKSLADGVLTVTGVGLLRGKSFVCDAEFSALLNRFAPTAPVRTIGAGSSGRRFAAISTAVVLSAAIGASAYFIFYRDSSGVSPDIDSGGAVVISAGDDNDVRAIDASNSAIDIFGEEPDGAFLSDESSADVESPADDAVCAPSDRTAEPTTAVAADIRFRVIIGSYSTRENAERAVDVARARVADLQYEIRPLGRLFAVAAFGSSTREECEEFIRAHDDDFPQAWVHPARR